MTELTVLFECARLIAIDKPEGLLSIPGGSVSERSVLEWLESRFDTKIYTVHRLDRDTSGVIVFAKNSVAHKMMNEQFSLRKISKKYLALVQGRVPDGKGIIDRPIRQYGSGRMGVDPVRGKPSLTRYQVTQRGGAHSLLLVSPTTGRRHQIRVHLFHLGHPIVGDRRYGDPTVQKKYPRLMLHAAELSFIDPATEAVITITAPVPPSFEAVCAEWV